MNQPTLKTEYTAFLKPSAKQPESVDVPSFSFLMIDGSGNPNTPAFEEKVSALYSVSYALKYHIKKTQGINFKVMEFEGLWWADDMNTFTLRDKDAWSWTIMIMQPDAVTPEVFEAIRLEVAKKKNLPALDLMRFDTYHEGLAAQIMHIGSYDAEEPTIEKLHDYIAAQGKERSGKHHEIYLTDPRKGDPKKGRTIIRQPMR